MLQARPYHLGMQRKRAHRQEWKKSRGRGRGHQDAVEVQSRLEYQEGSNLLVVNDSEQPFSILDKVRKHTNEIPHQPIRDRM